jgi:MFS family permease
LVSIYADPTEQGTILGAAQAFAALGRTVGPLVMGSAYDGMGSRSSFLLAAGVMLVGGLISLWLKPVSHAPARAPEPG